MTYKQEYKRVVDELKKQLQKVRRESKATKKDIAVVLEDYLRGDGDYIRTFHTKLYSNLGGEYTSLLEILSSMDYEGYFDRLKSLKE